MDHDKVAVIGGGTMGNGIAQVFAVSGHSVSLYDVSQEARSRGIISIRKRLERLYEKGRIDESPDSIMNRVNERTSLEQLQDSHLVIEAIVERLDVKQELFRKLDKLCEPTTVLATNTSSLSVTEIAAVVTHPERVVGMHFFNPAPIMALVEVVESRFSCDLAIDTAISYVKAAGKVPIRVSDSPSFIVNRIARPYYNESLRLVGDRVATFEQVDRIMKSAGFRMGPFELQDLIGIDINYATTRFTFDAFFGDARFRPHPIQRTMVQAGTLGRKTGRGYYRYDQK